MMQVNILEYSYKFIISNIVIDKISKLIMNLSKKSSYTGTINGDNTAKKGNGYLTSKGLLDLVERYDDIKYYIENNIKR